MQCVGRSERCSVWAGVRDAVCGQECEMQSVARSERCSVWAGVRDAACGQE